MVNGQLWGKRESVDIYIYIFWGWGGWGVVSFQINQHAKEPLKFMDKNDVLQIFIKSNFIDYKIEMDPKLINRMYN